MPPHLQIQQLIRDRVKDKHWEQVVAAAVESPVLSAGGNKSIHLGIANGKKVAVCIATTTKADDVKRLEKEIQFFAELGQHPNLVRVHFTGVYNQRPFIIQEAVEPIGYDLSRLVNQYSWAGRAVPSSLAARLIRQLAQGLRHMHACGILHRDLKTENVLVTSSYDAKLIDLGIACKTGTMERLRAPYLAPEMHLGAHALGPSVDCWGCGLILHQVYQWRWDLIDPRVKPPQFVRGAPSTRRPMESNIREVMMDLLKLDPDERMTLQELLQSSWLHENAAVRPPSESDDGLLAPMEAPLTARTHLQRYIGDRPPLTAFAARISTDMHNVIGKTLKDLHFLAEARAVVLLVDTGRGGVQRVPSATTALQIDHWVYFGVGTDVDIDEAMQKIAGKMYMGGEVDDKGRTTSKRGNILPFTLEFDCFTFPDHIGDQAVIGPSNPSGGPALNLRAAYNINLAGIVRDAAREPEWFPGPVAAVRPGDLGLVVRLPCKDGSTRPTMEDEAAPRARRWRTRTSASSYRFLAVGEGCRRSTVWGPCRQACNLLCARHVLRLDLTSS